MPKQTKKILTAEEIAINNYYQENQETFNEIRKIMNKVSRRENLIGGAIAGSVLGIIIGALVGDTKARVPVKNMRGETIDYTFNPTKMASCMLTTLAAMILITLSMAMLQTMTDTSNNSLKAQKLTAHAFKSYFKTTFAGYTTPIKPSNFVRAASLILDNMQESEVRRLRELAIYGLVRDSNGEYLIRDEYIVAAAQIVSNFVGYNPEIEKNVFRIIQGGQPTTYFLTDAAKQKTR